MGEGEEGKGMTIILAILSPDEKVKCNDAAFL
jgi:hypothetical protein